VSRFVTFVAIILFLTGATLPAQSVTHANLKGKWFGTGHQIDEQTWPIALQFKNNRITINYPSLACKGDWTLIKTDHPQLMYKETIKKGIENCDQGAEVYLTPIDSNRIKVVYYLRAYHPTQPVAEGVLSPEASKLKKTDLQYVILNNGDTIYGSRKLGWFNRTGIRFHTKGNTVTLPYTDIKEIYSNNRTYWVYISPCDGYWEEYQVLIRGPVSLLHNGATINTHCHDMLVINNRLYHIYKRHFSDDVWHIMSACARFKDKYQDYYHTNKDKKTFWRTRKDVSKWIEMIRYYNTNCN
jgi:hypothetical protein